MTPKEVKEILQIAKEFNLKHFSLNSLHVEFRDPIPPAGDLDVETERMPTEDELLFLSSGYDPQVEAKPPELD